MRQMGRFLLASTFFQLIFSHLNHLDLTKSEMRIVRVRCSLFLVRKIQKQALSAQTTNKTSVNFISNPTFRMKERYQQKKNQTPAFITYDEFNLLLSTLPRQQASELQQIINNHTLIQHKRKQGYFTGNKSFLQEIHYLINKYTKDITYLESDLSVSQSIEHFFTNKHVFYGQSLNIDRNNYKQVMEDIKIATALPSNRFELCINDSKRETIKLEITDLSKQIMITNRSVNNKRIYMIFEHIHQIIELQSLIDEEIPLFMFKQVIDYFQDGEGNNMSRSTISNNKEIFFFRRKSDEDWDKFINVINKKFASDDQVILMKFRHFPELTQRKHFFLSHVKVVFDQDEIKFNAQQISQLKIYQNTLESMHQLSDLALQLLTINSSYFKFNERELDPISAFNALLLEERKVDTMYYIDGKSQKQYVYFTFYKKLMEIQRGNQGQTVNLIERILTQQITNKFYLQALQKLRKHAVVNQLPFFLLYQQVSQLEKISLPELEETQTGDISRLLYYRYSLRKKKLKWVTESSLEEKSTKNKYEKHCFITFDKASPMFSKMSKLKSQSIIKKVKIKERSREKGKMEVQSEFGRLFIDKCIEQLGFK